MSQGPQTGVSPERIWQMLHGFQLSAVLKGAIDLELFTAIAEGNTSLPAIARRIAASERGTRILCDYLAVAGLLTKNGGEYGLAADAQLFLDRHSQAYIGGTTRFLHHKRHFEAVRDIAETVRRGTTLLNGRELFDVEHDAWVEFAKGMMPVMMPAAQYMAGLVETGDQPVRILDVAAGHGLFGAVMASRHPGAKVTAVDFAGVLAVAAENAQAFGVADRWEALPGSAMEIDLGGPYDVVLLTNFLHHFDEEENGRILNKVGSVLKPGGTLLTLEFVPDEDRLTPPAAGAFSMTMLVTTPAGDAYTFPELERMLRQAGFQENELHSIPNSPERVIVSHRG